MIGVFAKEKEKAGKEKVFSRVSYRTSQRKFLTGIADCNNDGTDDVLIYNWNVGDCLTKNITGLST